MTRFRLLIANGCSYTRGAELKDPERKSWPALLGERLNIPHVNIASDGGSNRRIVRTTLANLDDLLQRHGVDPAETLVICMWTGLARTEHYRALRHDKGNRADLPHETHWYRMGRWRIEEGDEASKHYFQWFWNERQATVDMALDWSMFDSSLRSRGVDARYTYAWDIFPRRIPAEAKTLLPRHRRDVVFGGLPVEGGSSFFETINGRFAVGPLGHPLEDAHEHFAGLLAAWVANGGPSSGR